VADISPYTMTNLTLRLDASRPETIVTNAAGLVTKWTSLEGGKHEFTKAPHVTEGMLPLYEPDAGYGRGGIHFGWDPSGTRDQNGTRVTTGLETADKIPFVTTFIVYDLTDPFSQGASTYRYHGLVGQNADSSNMNMAFYYFEWRSGGSFIAPFYHDGVENWKVAVNKNMASVVRGFPHVVTACTAQSNAVKGNNPVEVGCCTGTKWPDRYHVGRIYEVLMYDRLLSTNEIEIVQRSLMAKWGVTPAAALTNICDLLPPMRYAVGADGVIDCGGGDQTMVSLSGAGCVTNVRNLVVTDGVSLAGNLSVFSEGFETPTLALTAAAGFFPCLSLACDWDMTGTALTLVPTADMKRGPLVTSDGELTGLFVSVVGSDGGTVRYAPHRVTYSCGGLLLLFR